MEKQTNKSLVYASSTFFIIVLVTALLVFVNLIVGQLESKFDIKIDLSEGQRYSASEEAKEFISKLNKEVKLVFFAESEYERVKHYVEDYKKSSDKIVVEIVDADVNPEIAKMYEEDGKRFSPSSMVIKSGEKYEVLDVNEFLGSDYNTKQETNSFDQKVTGAINLVTDDKPYVIGVLEGHGEKKLEEVATFKDIIDYSGYKTKVLKLMGQKMPSGITVLAILNPSVDITPDELETITKYLDEGGRLFVTSEFRDKEKFKFANLNKLLSEYNIRINQDLIIEPDRNMSSAESPTYFFPEMKMEQPISTNYTQNISVHINQACSISILEESDTEKLNVKPILTTSGQSWGMTDFSSMQINKSDSDEMGPLNVAVLAEKDIGKEYKTRIIVFGDTTLFEGTFNPFLAQSSSYIVRDTLKWLGERDNTIAIPEKVYDSQYFEPSMSQLIFALVVALLIPLLLFTTGIIIKVRRGKL